MARAKFFMRTGFSIILVLMCITALVLWVVGDTHITSGAINSPVARVGFSTAANLASFFVQVPPLPPHAKTVEITGSTAERQAVRYYSQLLQPTEGFADFNVWLVDYPSTGRALGVTAPLWSIALISAILPAVFVIRYLRSRKENLITSRCVVCRYDIRATPHRCPECGNVPKVSNAD